MTAPSRRTDKDKCTCMTHRSKSCRRSPQKNLEQVSSSSMRAEPRKTYSPPATNHSHSSNSVLARGSSTTSNDEWTSSSNARTSNKTTEMSPRYLRHPRRSKKTLAMPRCSHTKSSKCGMKSLVSVERMSTNSMLSSHPLSRSKCKSYRKK